MKSSEAVMVFVLGHLQHWTIYKTYLPQNDFKVIELFILLLLPALDEQRRGVKYFRVFLILFQILSLPNHALKISSNSICTIPCIGKIRVNGEGRVFIRDAYVSKSWNSGIDKMFVRQYWSTEVITKLLVFKIASRTSALPIKGTT